MTTATSRSTSRPVKQFRLGLIVAGIFENEHDGKTYHNVTITRLYKQERDAHDWQRTKSFGRDDLPKVIEVTRQAWVWIHERQQGE